MALPAYRLLSQLGAGRDGVSYRAAPEAGGEAVELRQLDRARADPSRWAALVKRLGVAIRLKHPAALQVETFAASAEPPYVVVAFDDRPTLLERAGGTEPTMPGALAGEAVAVAVTVAGALASAHRLGLVHGALGPWAIRGGGPGLLSIDFTGIDTGSASQRHAEHASLPEKCRAPEVRAGEEPSAAADLFSLGALIAWLCAGETPAASWCPRATHPVHPALVHLVESLIAIDPEERPPAAEAEIRLRGTLEAPGESTAPESQKSGTSEWSVAPSASNETIGMSRSDETSFQPVRLTGLVSGEPVAAAPFARERLGRFRLVSKLGQGGMGEVYKGVDEADGSVVALKILRPDLVDRPSSLRRFHKEARLLGHVRNPFVTNLLEVNEDDGVHYIVLEFVAGASLDRVLADRGRLDERTALAVTADVARGLMDAHRLGIVHRDVKPSNVLIVDALPEAVTCDGSGVVEGRAPRVKLSDFGLARHAVEAESQLLTQSGVIVGTPTYMAPEQCAGGEIDCRADVYSLGATLFHLVAGRPPFQASDWRGVIAKHLNDPPPLLAALNPSVSEGLARVVERTLAKSPEARYADAGALLSDLERLLGGEPTGLPMHPALPEAEPGRVLAFDFAWDLDSPPRRLWPFVSNTDRLDQALGFEPVQYRFSVDPALGVRRFLEGRKAGMVEAGEEHPYEWVEGRRLGVFREYSKGPFKWVVSAVELAPRGARTRLTHKLRLEPRGRLMRLGSRWGVGSRLKRDMERVYRRIDASVSGKLGADPAVDPFEPAPELSDEHRQRLNELLAALVERGIHPDVVARLGDFLASAPDGELSRIRPIALARRLSLPEEAVIAACLHAANVGLLVLLWDLLCPICRIPSDVKETLRALSEHGRCEACQMDYSLDFASSVELIFRVHPQIRQADTNTYCASGPSHSPHVVAQVRVQAGERLELDLDMSEGRYRLRGPQLGWALDFKVRPGTVARRWDLSLAHGPASELVPELGTGGQVLAFSNDSDHPLILRVERVAPRDDALTAARASSLAVFRTLFPAEVLAPGRLVSVASVTLLVTAVDADGPSLYETLGDARAFSILHEQFHLIDELVREAGGALVKTIGEGVLCVFADPNAAVRAALAIPEALAAGETTADLRIRILAHRGPAMAATLNDHLDYFGTTVHQSLEALEATPAGSLVLTRAVASDPDVAGWLRQNRIAGTLLPDSPAGRAVGPLLRIEFPALSPIAQTVRPGERPEREQAKPAFTSL
jgi:serine/threonine protein kinase/class 3 adenylate cyclase